MDANPDTYDMTLTRQFDAPVEQVWRAWSDPALVMGWWGPAGFTAPVARMDFREGGASLVCMRVPAGYGGQDQYNTWTYQKIVPFQRIEFVQHFVDADGNRVSPGDLGLPAGIPFEVPHVLTFKALDGGRTEMTVNEYGYPSGQLAAMSRLGMDQCLDKMALLLEQERNQAAAGPLVVSRANPRYFTVASGGGGRAVYLTGAHIWNNFEDGMGLGSSCAAAPEPFDFPAYLSFLKERGHNFIRLWRWEQFQSQAAGGSYHLCMSPQPWPRTGPGTAKDGQPKFDLDQFDPAYFDRLRQHVIAAGEQGIYVDVMLFDGWALHLSPSPDNVEGHPFHAASNVNGIGIASILDYQLLPLDPRLQALQEAYIRKVVDTVQDLPNVLYEVANESSGGGPVDPAIAQMLGVDVSTDWGDSTGWQYWVIDTLKRYEQERGYTPHPIGMTMQWPVADQTRVNEPLYRSPADWISPGYDDEIFASGELHPMAPGSPPSRWYDNPPAGDGAKVVITDTDHYSGMADALWAWKSFLRGHNPVLMDFGLIEGVSPPAPSPQYEAFEAARFAMGDTRRYAERMDLLAMQPRGEQASTGYALASPGQEYLILQPDDAAPFTVSLEPGAYTVEWFSVSAREPGKESNRSVEPGAVAAFTPPFAGPAVLYLKRAA